MMKKINQREVNHQNKENIHKIIIIMIQKLILKEEVNLKTTKIQKKKIMNMKTKKQNQEKVNHHKTTKILIMIQNQMKRQKERNQEKVNHK